ncbi:P-loop NTPase [Phycicoccus endophyticus]|uniref:P-loop NTPase n=1 Tax=Phycicoccus endophyticus TaxID=1690220 RepID=A0A7G9R0U3_9MICO|nr:P-loop NTPase [Phycicoccus endophyticus]NHI19509.1 P-loop NTPase [Phycicoccus endophyticus]QNN49218.1 P-loop NTPase [Phycicoccus endophyticus]GGL39733.1 hypothetical protein GCM10012283_22800 [Phycicoccus endophyticus]
MTRVIIGMEGENLVADLMSILDEMDGYDVRAVAKSPSELLDLLGRLEPEIVFVHDSLGIEPISQTIRDIIARRPSAAVLQVSHSRTSDVVIKAMEDGARGVVAYPFAYEDVSNRVLAATDWTQHMEAVLAGAAMANTSRGTVLAVVGAKGGVGTTTIAAHMAHDHLVKNPGAKVCLIDVDIEKGDVGAIFEVRQSVSIADVAKVSGDLSPTAVNDAVIHHASGVNLLLAPLDVRDADFVTPAALRSIVALLRREFDLVIADGGGHVSPAQAAMIELAGECLVVTTPDVLSVRAMRRRMIAWESLGVREEAAFKVLVNKTDSSSLFPASAVEKLTTAEVLETKIPSSPRVLEASMNDRDPRAVTEVAWWRLIEQVRDEVGLGSSEGGSRGSKPARRRRGRARGRASTSTPQAPATAAEPPSAAEPTPTDPGPAQPAPASTPPPRVASESGAVAMETAGILPATVLLILIAWQVGVTGFSFLYAGHASAEAARAYSVTGSTSEAAEAAREAVPSVLRDRLSVSAHGDTVSVTVPIPKGSGEVTGLPTELTSTRTVVSER